MGFLLFVLMFHAELVPNLSLIINAPNAIRNDFAGAPVEQVNFWAYSSTKILTMELFLP
jgi:hypothetical protein